ncbi:MAG: penicillin-binding transpeptidase domain-containing protein [Dehalococcoidia bacterium]
MRARITIVPVLALLIVACGGGGEPTVTERPSTALETAGRFLQLWQDGEYADMYGFLSAESGATIDEKTFIGRYEAIKEEARIETIEFHLSSDDSSLTEIPFEVIFTTSFFGTIPQDNLMPLVQEEVTIPAATPGGESQTRKEWRVSWTPSLYFKELDAESLVNFFTRAPRRGAIYDRNQKPLAIDADLTVVGVVPDLVTDPGAVINTLAPALGVSADEVSSAVTNDLPTYYFNPIKTLPYGTPPAEAQKFHDMVDLGVVVREETQRIYPNGAAAAHVLGYMTEVSEDQLKTLAGQGFGPGDLIGAAGLEGQYDELLGGKRGALLATVSPEGAIGATIAEKASEPGQDIYLALDVAVQKKAEAELGERVGSIVVMDPRDNSVLALASFPRFDPNAFIRGLTQAEADSLFNDPRQPFLNRALLAEYPPGSTFKPVTMAAGLEKGGYSTGSTIHCVPVWTGLGEDFPQKNWQTVDRGWLTLSEGLMASCNPVFFELAKSLDEIDENLFPDYIRQFGYGSATGIGMEEAAGLVPDPKWKEENIGDYWYRGDAVNMGIGQGYVTATPIQIVNAYSAISRSGVLRKPLLITKIGTAGSATFKEFAAEDIRPLPASQETLDAIRYGLYLVTQGAGGTSYQAWAGSSVDAAGKSGTAEDLAQGSDHVFFVAYAQRGDPSIVALGALETGESGSREVAPMLRHILEAYIGGQLAASAP